MKSVAGRLFLAVCSVVLGGLAVYLFTGVAPRMIGAGQVVVGLASGALAFYSIKFGVIAVVSK